MLTRCSSCHAWFKVRAEHLSAASGFVTCGNCDTVFNALATLVEDDVPPPILGESVANDDPAIEHGGPATDEAGTPHAADMQVSTKADRNAGDTPDEGHDRPESLPEFENTLSTEHFADETPAVEASELAVAPPSRPAASVTLPAEEHAILFTEPGSVEAAQESDDGAAPTERFDDEIESTEPPDVPPAIEQELAALDGRKPRPTIASRLWQAVAALLMLALALQVLYVFRAEVMQHFPQSEPFYARVCAHVPCEDVLVERDVIRLLARDVREHPQYHDALLVNATLINNGAAPEPFPAIGLKLINGVGELIGARRFEPAEYLDDSIEIEAGMPPEQPIYVVMEIGGDAASATSFEFSFL